MSKKKARRPASSRPSAKSSMSPKPGVAATMPQTESATEAAAATGARQSMGGNRGLLVVLLMALLAFFFYLSGQIDQSQNAIPAPPSIQVPDVPGEQARAMIAALGQPGKPITPADIEELYRQAESLSAEGAVTDAYLLYFYLARKGHAMAAMKLGEMSDPASGAKYQEATGEPDYTQALKWYRIAAKAAVPDAQQRLDQLIAQMRSAAAAGDPNAKRALLEVE